MRRQAFVESQGATCKNWMWSWSFVNHKTKVILFGAWDVHTEKGKALILAENWEISPRGRRQPGYSQALEHIKLIEEEGYVLQTFPMIYSDGYKDAEGVGPSKIGDVVPELTTCTLQKIGDKWYAVEGAANLFIPEEIDHAEAYFEGASTTVSVNSYERSAEARAACIAHHGYSCAACGFDFEQVYGDIGKNYIHVHHIVPLSSIGKTYKIDPVKDLVPVCPNCHAMIHTSKKPLSIKKIRKRLNANSG